MPLTFQMLTMVAALAACAATPRLAAAEVLFDDHFTGNSGGVPAGWFGSGDGSAVETGSVVALDGTYTIATNQDFDANQKQVTTITVHIAGTNHHTHAGLIDFAEWANHFWVKLHAADGQVEVKASDVAGGEHELTVGHVEGYTGGAIRLTVSLAVDAFLISTDNPPFSAGPIAYSTISPSFGRDDLGHAAKLILESECSEGPCQASYDRIVLEATTVTPTSATSWGSLKEALRR